MIRGLLNDVSDEPFFKALVRLRWALTDGIKANRMSLSKKSKTEAVSLLEVCKDQR